MSNEMNWPDVAYVCMWPFNYRASAEHIVHTNIRTMFREDWTRFKLVDDRSYVNIHASTGV